jgi:transcriptional regulator with XRE-family HTH domain
MDKPAFSQTPFDVVLLSKALGESLKVARKRRGMTQSEVAMRIGTAREVVMNAEKGKSVTSYNLMAMLWLYGLLNQAINSISDDKDVVGMSFEKSKLPMRVRKKVSDAEF